MKTRKGKEVWTRKGKEVWTRKGKEVWRSHVHQIITQEARYITQLAESSDPRQPTPARPQL